MVLLPVVDSYILKVGTELYFLIAHSPPYSREIIRD